MFKPAVISLQWEFPQQTLPLHTRRAFFVLFKELKTTSWIEIQITLKILPIVSCPEGLPLIIFFLNHWVFTPIDKQEHNLYGGCNSNVINAAIIVLCVFIVTSFNQVTALPSTDYSYTSHHRHHRCVVTGLSVAAFKQRLKSVWRPFCSHSRSTSDELLHLLLPVLEA